MGEIVRRHDPDRFFTALFAPAERREALFTLYAFNHELARAREMAREPMMALIRLQWWREVVEGARRRHEVAGPLGAVLDAGMLLPADLLGMLEGREMEAEPLGTLAAWRSYVLAAAGGVAVAAGHVLGGPPGLGPALRAYGAAYGVSGLLRSVAALARQGRSVFPEEMLPGGADAQGPPWSAAARAARGTLAWEAHGWLAEARQTAIPRCVLAAALPAAFAGADLRRLDRDSGLRSPWRRGWVLAASLRGSI